MQNVTLPSRILMQLARAVNWSFEEQIIPLADRAIHPAKCQEIPTNRSNMPMSI
jgi:hypothetical protein